MKLTSEPKIQNGGTITNGSLSPDETDLELQKAFEGKNGSIGSIGSSRSHDGSTNGSSRSHDSANNGSSRPHNGTNNESNKSHGGSSHESNGSSNGSTGSANGSNGSNGSNRSNRLSDGSSSTDSLGSVSPVDTIPFNIEGIQTVVKNSFEAAPLKNNHSTNDYNHPTNGCNHSTTTTTNNNNHNSNNSNKNSNHSVGGSTPNLVLEAEFQRVKEENAQLRAALKEASRVNQQWRHYDDKRQGYVLKLLNSLQDRQQATSLTQASGRSSVELQRLRETFCRHQKEHNEHIQLLQLQVRAHRDDWGAERSEKKAAELCRHEAETKLQMVKRQLEEATNRVSELDNRLKLCKCFLSLNGESTTNIDRRGISPFYQPNSNALSAGPEITSRISPNFSSSSSNSMCSGTSRSSSVSKDLSTCSSPNIIPKSMQSLSPYNVSTENSRTSSPCMRISTKSSSQKNGETQQHCSEKNGVDSQYCALLNPHNYGDEVFVNSSNKINQNGSDHNSCSTKSKGSGKAKGEVAAENSLHYYESRGARPKVSAKSNDEDETEAKHRARSILASALPMSPSSSKPSSPITVSTSDKENKISKGYVPITSTVLTPVNYKPNDQNHSKEGNTIKINQQCESPKSAFTKVVESSKYISSINGSNENLPHCSKGNEATDLEKNYKPSQPSSDSFSSKGNISPNCKLSCRKSCENLVIFKSNDQPEYKQCSSIQINGLKCQHSGSNEQKCCGNTTNTESGEVSKVRVAKSEMTKDTLDVKTASIMKQNTKSLIVTNNQQEKLNTNYASITVMPGPSSALYSHTPSTSTTSSRSSSPGISLTTFALNANGQGIPGAIFFDLSSETKSPKSLQPTLSVSSSSTSIESQEELVSTKNNPTTCKELPELGTNDRIVNSTWVQLMDKENQSARQPSRTPWRTARAVPSHKLNSVRKNHPDDTSYNGMISTTADNARQNEPPYPVYNCMVGNTIVCNGNSHPKTQHNYETKYQTSFSPPPTYISCSRTSPNNLLSPNQSYSESSFRNANSPTICIIPHSNQAYAEADLRSMASRNISSAILSYECGNKGCTASQGKKQVIAKSQNGNVFYDEQLLKPCLPVESSSEHCLVCPSCQKIFTQENIPKYTQHLQICGGPKYVDM